MAHTVDTIDHATLEHLVQAGAVRGAHVIGQPGGWGVVVQYGMTERALAARRGAVRLFRKFETLAGYLKEVGIQQYQVDARLYDPTALKVERSRTDAAARMKATHEGAAYNKMFEAKVAASLAGLKDGTNKPFTDKQWAAELQKRPRTVV